MDPLPVIVLFGSPGFCAFLFIAFPPLHILWAGLCCDFWFIFSYFFSRERLVCGKQKARSQTDPYPQTRPDPNQVEKPTDTERREKNEYWSESTRQIYFIFKPDPTEIIYIFLIFLLGVQLSLVQTFVL